MKASGKNLFLLPVQIQSWYISCLLYTSICCIYICIYIGICIAKIIKCWIDRWLCCPDHFHPPAVPTGHYCLIVRSGLASVRSGLASVHSAFLPAVCPDSVSYTHLDVYKRQRILDDSQISNAFCNDLRIIGKNRNYQMRNKRTNQNCNNSTDQTQL